MCVYHVVDKIYLLTYLFTYLLDSTLAHVGLRPGTIETRFNGEQRVKDVLHLLRELVAHSSSQSAVVRVRYGPTEDCVNSKHGRQSAVPRQFVSSLAECRPYWFRRIMGVRRPRSCRLFNPL